MLALCVDACSQSAPTCRMGRQVLPRYLRQASQTFCACTGMPCSSASWHLSSTFPATNDCKLCARSSRGGQPHVEPMTAGNGHVSPANRWERMIFSGWESPSSATSKMSLPLLLSTVSNRGHSVDQWLLFLFVSFDRTYCRRRVSVGVRRNHEINSSCQETKLARAGVIRKKVSCGLRPSLTGSRRVGGQTCGLGGAPVHLSCALKWKTVPWVQCRRFLSRRRWAFCQPKKERSHQTSRWLRTSSGSVITRSAHSHRERGGGGRQ